MWDWPARSTHPYHSKCLQRLSGNTGVLAWQQGINKEDLDILDRGARMDEACIWQLNQMPASWSAPGSEPNCQSQYTEKRPTSLLSAGPSACPKLNHGLSQFQNSEKFKINSVYFFFNYWTRTSRSYRYVIEPKSSKSGWVLDGWVADWKGMRGQRQWKVGISQIGITDSRVLTTYPLLKPCTDSQVNLTDFLWWAFYHVHKKAPFNIK